MKITMIALTFLFIFSGCGGPSVRPGGTPITIPPGPITIQNMVPFSQGSIIYDGIKQECNISKQLSDFTKQYAAEEGIQVLGADDLNTNGPGNVLLVEITNAVSQGTVFIGHNKSTTIRGELYRDGTLLASFRGSRRSGGGLWGGYKGSCAVLGRTVKTLGSDIVAWLKHPSDNAYLGD